MASQFIRKLNPKPTDISYQLKIDKYCEETETRRKRKPAAFQSLTVLLPSFGDDPPKNYSPDVIRRKPASKSRSRIQNASQSLFTSADHNVNPHTLFINNGKNWKNTLHKPAPGLNLSYKTLLLDSSTSSNAKKLHPIAKSYDLEIKNQKKRQGFRLPARKVFNHTWMDKGMLGTNYYMNPVQKMKQNWSHIGSRVLKRELDRNSIQTQSWVCNSPSLIKNEIDTQKENYRNEIEQEIKNQQEKREKEARRQKVAALWRQACAKVTKERRERKTDVTKQLWTIYEELLKINRERKDAEMKNKVTFLTTQFNKIMHSDDWGTPGEKRTENLALDMEKIKADTIRGIHQKIEDASSETDREEMLRTLGNLTCSTIEQDRMLYIHTSKRKPKLAKRNPFANISSDKDASLSAAQKTKNENLIAEFLQKETSKVNTKKTPVKKK